MVNLLLCYSTKVRIQVSLYYICSKIVPILVTITKERIKL